MQNIGSVERDRDGEGYAQHIGDERAGQQPGAQGRVRIRKLFAQAKALSVPLLAGPMGSAAGADDEGADADAALIAWVTDLLDHGKRPAACTASVWTR